MLTPSKTPSGEGSDHTESGGTADTVSLQQRNVPEEEGANGANLVVDSAERGGNDGETETPAESHPSSTEAPVPPREMGEHVEGEVPAPTEESNGISSESAEHHVVAYTVEEDTAVIDDLHQRLGATEQELDMARSRLSTPVVVGVPLTPEENVTKSKKRTLVVSVSVLLAAIAVVVGISVYFARQNGEETIETSTDVVQLPPVLESLKERGVLRCGIIPDGNGFSRVNDETGVREGIEIDFCKAIAAASLGEHSRYEFIGVSPSNRFVTLASGAVDLVIAATTHTMERDIYQPSAKTGFTFSTPYLYGGIAFGGIPEYLACADELNVVGDCAGLMICVIPGTTWMDVVQALFPRSNVVVVAEQSNYLEGLINGFCNVIVGEQFDVPELAVRLLGYEGPYASGKNIFSRDPLAIVTRDYDPEFSDFANWVLQGLFNAEAQNITMETADTFAETEIFGDQYKNMFKNALAAVGNYGEIYARNLEKILPRLTVNMINNGDTGVLYSHPFGDVGTIGPGPIKGGMIESIIQRGYIRCGITLPDYQGILEDDQVGSITDERVVLDMEFCRVLSACVFDGVSDKISFESFPETGGYDTISLALENGEIDVFAGGEVRMSGDVRRPGLSFSKPYFYEVPDGNSGTTRAFSLVTKDDDSQWTGFVYWAIIATFYAEENGIIQTTSNKMPLTNLFGSDFMRMLRDIIIAVGNYGEIYQRVFGQNSTRVGLNALNSGASPQHYPLPLE